MQISPAKYIHYLNTFERLADSFNSKEGFESIHRLVTPEYQSKLQSNLYLLELDYNSRYHQTSEILTAKQCLRYAAVQITLTATLPRVKLLLERVRELSGDDRVGFLHSFDYAYPYASLCSATLFAADLAKSSPVGWAGYKKTHHLYPANPAGMPQNGSKQFYLDHNMRRLKAPELNHCLDLLALWVGTLFGIRRIHKIVDLSIEHTKQIFKTYINPSKDINVQTIAASRIFTLILKSTPTPIYQPDTYTTS